MKIGLLVRIEAKPEHAAEVRRMLADALEPARQEPQTLAWFAFQESETVFGVFDTFEDEDGRQVHLDGAIAAALMQATPKLSAAPDIHRIDLLGVKVP
jgi:quinol monooxygenase YgiN